MTKIRQVPQMMQTYGVATSRRREYEAWLSKMDFERRYHTEAQLVKRGLLPAHQSETPGFTFVPAEVPDLPPLPEPESDADSADKFCVFEME